MGDALSVPFLVSWCVGHKGAGEFTIHLAPGSGESTCFHLHKKQSKSECPGHPRRRGGGEGLK